MSDGRLRVDGYLTRTGVFEYMMSDGTIRREYRAPEEVFKKDSLETFELAPVTDDHPPEMVTADNAKRYAIGAIGDTIRRDGQYMRAQLSIFDANLIAKMEAGKIQISCGYTCDLVEESGVTPEGEHYDWKQTNIVGNHVAVVDVGRAGPQAAVRMDAAYQVPDSGKLDGSKQSNEVGIMELKEALDLLKQATERADAATQEVATARADADKLAAERDSALAQLAKLEKDRTDAADQMAARVDSRVSLITKASAFLPAGDLSKLSDRAIKCQVIKHLDGADVADDKSDVYVDGRYDAAIDRAAKGEEQLANVRTVVAEVKADAGEDAETKAANAMRERNRNAYLNTLKGSN